MQKEARTISILLVDDDREFGDLTVDALSRQNERFTIQRVMSASEALKRLAAESFDCIVSDHNMPGQTGIELLETVRKKYGGIPFFLFTGKGSEQVASKAISAGVTDYLQKDGGMEQYEILANRIRNSVQKTRAEHMRENLRERMEFALTQTDSVIFEIDLDDGEVMRLGQVEQFLTVPSDRVSTWEEYLHQVVHPDDREEFKRFYQQLAHGERDSGTIEYKTNPEIGDVRWIRGSVAIQQDGSQCALGLAQDITDQKECNREREKITNRVTEAIVEVDENWRFTFVNEQAEAVYSMTEASLLEENFWDVFSEAEGTRFEEEYRRAMETRETVSFMEYFSGLDGWFDVQVYPEDDGGLSFYFREVSNRLESDSAIEKESHLIDEALSELNDVLYVVGPDGTLQWWNDRVSAVTGYTDEEIADIHILDLFPEDDQGRISEAVEETFTTGEAVVEAEVVAKNGDHIPHEFTGDQVTDEMGDLIGLVGTGREITERKEREHRLKELNQMGHKLMATDSREQVAKIGVESAAAILGLDVTGIHLYEPAQSGLVPVAHTPASKQLVPDPPIFTGGNSIAWQVYEQGVPITIDNVRTEPNVYNPETSIRSELFLPIEEHGILIASATDPQAFNEEDILLGKILVGTIAASLDQVERTEQLRTRERELREQNERLEEFTSVVSHDLQNPLQVAIGRMELVMNESNNEHLDTIAAALDRMDILITDLLTLAREGDDADELETINLEPLAKNTWQYIGTGEATLVVAGDMTIRADESRFRQLLENLMSNAVEHGGTDVTVTVGTHDNGFFVEDDGPGIPEEERENVFVTGYSTTDQGTGFGLRIVNQAVEAHNWTIRVCEGVEGGARFEISTAKKET